VRLHLYNVCLSLTAINVIGKTNMLSKINQYRNMFVSNFTVYVQSVRLQLRRKSEGVCAIRRWLCR